MIVLDASVLTDYLLGRRPAHVAIDGALADDDQQPFHAPDLIELETLNVLRRLARAGLVDEGRASEAVRDLAEVRLIRHPHPPLRDRVWELRHQLTAYDASYLALAEAFDEPRLLTADRALAERGRRSLGGDCVVLVSG